MIPNDSVFGLASVRIKYYVPKQEPDELLEIELPYTKGRYSAGYSHDANELATEHNKLVRKAKEYPDQRVSEYIFGNFCANIQIFYAQYLESPQHLSHENERKLFHVLDECLKFARWETQERK